MFILSLHKKLKRLIVYNLVYAGFAIIVLLSFTNGWNIKSGQCRGHLCLVEM